MALIKIPKRTAVGPTSLPKRGKAVRTSEKCTSFMPPTAGVSPGQFTRFSTVSCMNWFRELTNAEGQDLVCEDEQSLPDVPRERYD
jgi:hypothetical protein